MSYLPCITHSIQQVSVPEQVLTFFVAVVEESKKKKWSIFLMGGVEIMYTI